MPLPDSQNVNYDAGGVATITVSAKHLRYFPALIKWIREGGYGRELGVLKLRLTSNDVRNEEVTKECTKVIEKYLVTDSGKEEFSYSPHHQVFFKAPSDHIYTYSRVDCTKKEREKFLKTMAQPSTFDASHTSCCETALNNFGVDGMIEHFFKFIDSISGANDNTTTKDLIKEGKYITYGAGMNIDCPISICEGFSLSSLGTILDLIDEEYDGISRAQVYCGSSHSISALHIEDGGLLSISYLAAGSPKVWIIYPPKYFGFIDQVVSKFPIPHVEKSCRCILGSHKILVIDPKLFKALNVPYTVVVQQPGEFVITLPFALHSDFNCGYNLAVAANFADEDWVELGMHPVVCGCFEKDPVQLNIKKILQECRPDLLQQLEQSPYMVFPPDHPRSIVYPPFKRKLQDAAGIELLGGPSPKLSTVTFQCPECPKSYKGKKSRLVLHIEIDHKDKSTQVLNKVEKLYPQKLYKCEDGFTCKVCGGFFRQSITHLLIHHKRVHKDVPYRGPAEKIGLKKQK